jgi:large subunit ribosomal protein L10
MSVQTRKVGQLCRDLIAAEIKGRLDEYSDVILFNYHRLKSPEMTSLRKSLKSVGSEVLVTKNSFMKKILTDAGKAGEVLSFIDGPMAAIFIKEDLVAAAKVIAGFMKEHEALNICGGFLADRVITREDIKMISHISSRKGLYQQVASTLAAPGGKLAMSLNQIAAKICYVLKAVSDKKK